MSTDHMDTLSCQPGGGVLAEASTSVSSYNSCTSDKEQQESLEDLRSQLDRANARLLLMSQRVRLLAAQMRQADLTAHPIQKIIANNDDHTVATDECDTVLSEEGTVGGTHTNNHSPPPRAPTFSTPSVDPADSRLCEIANDDLMAAQTADLLALQNAAHMLQQHARLASQEAVLAVHDAVAAQTSKDEFQTRALEAEHACEQLHTENVRLYAQNEKLKAERRVLIKEVRKLRNNTAHSKRQDYGQESFESYMVGAVNLHEQTMKKNAKLLSIDDASTFSVTSEEDASVTLKTDKPIRVELEGAALPMYRPQSTPILGNSRTKRVARATNWTGARPVTRNGTFDRLPKLSSFGGYSSTGFGRRHSLQPRSTQEDQESLTIPPSSPPQNVNVYPGDCVSPVMSYDSVDGVWALDSNQKLVTSDTEPGKEFSG